MLPSSGPSCGPSAGPSVGPNLSCLFSLLVPVVPVYSHGCMYEKHVMGWSKAHTRAVGVYIENYWGHRDHWDQTTAGTAQSQPAEARV